MTSNQPSPLPRRRRSWRTPAVLVAVAAAALGTGSAVPAGAQADPTALPGPSAAPSSTTLAPVPTAPGAPAPGAGPSDGGSVAPGPAPSPAALPDVVAVDRVPIDALLAEARARAKVLRGTQISAAAGAVTAADARVAEARGRVDEARVAGTAAAANVQQRVGEVEAIRRRIGSFAANAYMRVGTTRDETLARLRLGTGRGTDSAAVDAQQTGIYADKAVDAARVEMGVAAERLTRARSAQRDADGVVTARQSEVDALVAVAEAARTSESALRAAPLDVPAAASASALSGSGGPSILGRGLLDADDLAGFVRARGHPDPGVDVEALARAFVDEGGAEGVRADLAWAQSIIETGSFGFAGSMVRPSDHNYAGIGACDSCSTGFRYPTPEIGVRAQVQLLRTYADRGARTATLARPPVGRAPEDIGVRGCCSTWMALSGVWATGPQYGARILTVYNDLLRYAVERHRVAVPQ